MQTRRYFLKQLSALVALINVPLLSRADNDQPLSEALKATNLIYLSPIKSNGEESRCQAEVWFASSGTDMYVCTKSNTWRARAQRQGLDKARVWVGDLGVWTNTNGRYKSLPSVDTKVDLIEDKADLERILDLFGDKYSPRWLIWGRRFRNGLEDGSRIMLRYRPV